MEASCRHHLLSLHRMVGSVSSRTRQFTNFSEPKQIYWSKATANTFIVAFGNIPNIFCSIFLGVNFNYLQRNVRSQVSVSNFQVSVSAFFVKVLVSVSKLEPGLVLGSYGLTTSLH